MHLSMVLDVWLDMTGAAVAAASAVAVMAAVDVRVTLVVVVPVMIALGLCRLLGNRLRAWRRREREATAAVTGFIGDLFGAIGAVKVAGAEAAVARRFEELGETRADAARVDQVATQVLRTSSTAIGNLGTGLVVLLVVPALARGDATVGDVGLFAAAVSVLANLPRWAASTGAYHRQADVSVERMARLLPDRAPDGRGGRRRRSSCGTARARSAPRRSPRPDERVGDDALRELTVCGLTATHPGGGGIYDIDLTVPRGSLTAITGPVGAGKSTLLRCLLGLAPVDHGELRWNGQLVDDPSQLLVPPRAAYVAQVPRLFSEPLSDAILLGVEPDGLHDAVRLACLDDDVAWMPEGLATVVGRQGRAPLRRPDPAHRRRPRLRPPPRAARDRRHLQRARRRHRGPHVGAAPRHRRHLHRARGEPPRTPSSSAPTRSSSSTTAAGVWR